MEFSGSVLVGDVVAVATIAAGKDRRYKNPRVLAGWCQALPTRETSRISTKGPPSKAS